MSDKKISIKAEIVMSVVFVLATLTLLYFKAHYGWIILTGLLAWGAMANLLDAVKKKQGKESKTDTTVSQAKPERFYSVTLLKQEKKAGIGYTETRSTYNTGEILLHDFDANAYDSKNKRIIRIIFWGLGLGLAILIIVLSPEAIPFLSFPFFFILLLGFLGSLIPSGIIIKRAIRSSVAERDREKRGFKGQFVMIKEEDWAEFKSALEKSNLNPLK